MVLNWIFDTKAAGMKVLGINTMWDVSLKASPSMIQHIKGLDGFIHLERV